MSRVTVEDSVDEAGRLLASGVRSVLLFGIPEDKDEEGSGAYDDDGIVQLALRAVAGRAAGAASAHRRVPVRVHVDTATAA